MKKGIFYGVGVGPGDPELLTLKAIRLLERCPVIAAPRTKSGEMLALDIASAAVDLKEKTIVPLYFSMERDKAVQHAAHLAAAEAVLNSLLAAIQTHLERRAAGNFLVGAVTFSNEYGLLGRTETVEEILRRWRQD